MDGLARDLRQALRLLGCGPALTAAAVVSPAIGVGANTAIVGSLNGLPWRPLPMAGPDRVVSVYTGDFSGPAHGSSSWPRNRSLSTT